MTPTHPRPQPHPLRPGQRLALRGTRAAIAALTPVQRWRAARTRLGDVAHHRYGTWRSETLEILAPPADVERRTPVVYIHGGGWIFGRKELYSGDLAFLTERGHTVFNVDYPLAPEHPFPAPLGSLLAALRWIVSSRDDADEVHLMGDSAGGNLAMMLGLSCCQPTGSTSLPLPVSPVGLPRVRSVVSLYGVLDRLSWIEHGFPGARLMLHCYGGPGAFEPEVGPELALTPADVDTTRRPPCLLAIGSDDRLAASSRIARDRLAEDGERVELIEYPGERHGFFNARRRPAAQKLRADVLRFLDSA